MSDVKRYDPDAHYNAGYPYPTMEESKDGGYTKFSDYDALAAENAALKQRVAELEGMREEVLHYQKEFHRLRDRAAELEAVLPVRHVCGAQGFDSYRGDVCLACKAARESAP